MPLIKFVDMFSGIGGFREGLTRAGGFTCVGHCEIDKYANCSYRALFDTEGEWFVEDTRKADPETITEGKCRSIISRKAMRLLFLMKILIKYSPF